MSVLGHWLWLSMVPSLSRQTLNALLLRFGSPLEIYNASPAAQKECGASAAEVSALSSKNMEKVNEVLGKCARLGIGMITYQDAAYPERLAAIPSPPLVLYILGRLPAFDRSPAIGVIGAREASVYGLTCAKNLSHGLAAAGVIIVSGMAKGCDAAAHAGALEANRPTVAVLGCGVDICYPIQNKALYNDIPRTGAILSEYPPGTPPAAAHFPARNRIISGLSNGVLLVEAGKNSGALITASHALDQGRDVFAVPGSIDFPNSWGTNDLIKQGAKLTTEPGDILAELSPIYPDLSGPGAEKPFPPERDLYIAPSRPGARKMYKPPFPTVAALAPEPKAEPEQSDETDRLILGLLQKGDMYCDDLIAALGLPSSEVNAALTILEINGLVKIGPGDIVALK